MIKEIAIAASIIASMEIPTIRNDHGTVTNTCSGNIGFDHAVITTDDGNMWRINNADLEYGQSVTLVFNTNGTESIEDDVIIAFR